MVYTSCPDDLYCPYSPYVQCRQLCVKVCRCGKKEKSVLCSSEYLCDIRCTTLRQCGSHQCKRKVGGAREGQGQDTSYIANDS